MSTVDPTEFTSRVLKKREELGLSERAFLIKAGLGVDILRDVRRRGHIPGGDVVYKLSVALGVSVEWLLTGTGLESGAITDEEVKIIEVYRRLDPSQRILIRRLLGNGSS